MSSCRICLEEEGPFVDVCNCKGSSKYVHEKCLSHWIKESGNDSCEICKAKYRKDEVCYCDPLNYIIKIFDFESQNKIDRQKQNTKMVFNLFFIIRIVF